MGEAFSMLRVLIVAHRYLGVALGLLVTLWCLSGFVMMYQSYPGLEPGERLKGLAPLTAPVDLSRVPLPADARVDAARIEVSAGKPILKVTPADDPPFAFDLAAGQLKTGFSPAEALSIATAYAGGHGLRGPPRPRGAIERDQWTVQIAARHQPVYPFTFDDAAKSVIYVSGKTGEVIQDTTRRERVLSWFGAIPHWLYPTLLRQDPRLWTQVVVWSSALGVFLTATGLLIGIVHLRPRRASGRWSPFRGVVYWHHLSGLVFGVLTLTWVLSGLFSMTPFGLFAGDRAGEVAGKLAPSARWADVRQALESARPPPQTVQLSSVTLGERTLALAAPAMGRTVRLGPDGLEEGLKRQEVLHALSAGGLTAADFDTLTSEDAYYYGHHAKVDLPVYRAILDDAQKTRVYVDFVTGRIARIADADGRAYRWWQSALHDFDWPIVRRRPIWDFIVLPLLAGVTIACAIGVWMGVRRIRADLSGLRRRS